MPRSRKQVARFDPSPEVVASWNDTSGKTRVVVDLRARVRLGLSSAEAAAAAIAAAQAKASVAAAAAAAAAESPVLDHRRPSPAGAGRKRQRATPSVGGTGGTSNSGDGSSSCSPPISGLRAGHHHEHVAVEGGEGRGAGGSSVTDSSSVGCGTSGSDSDSLAWRPPQAAGGGGRADVGGGGGGASVVDASTNGSASASGASDTDSEYCSDLIPGQHTGDSSAPSCANSDGSSSCSVTPLSFGECPATTGVAAAAAATHAGAGVSGKVSPEGGDAKSQSRDGEEEERRRAAKKQRRNVVIVRLARSQMPARWAAPPSPFETCLKEVLPEDKLGGGAACGVDDAAAAAAASMVGLCGEGDVVDAKNWLSSGFIDVVMAKFARTYTNVSFMPIDFAVLCLNGWGASETAASGASAPGSAAQPPPSATSVGSGGESENGDRAGSSSGGGSGGGMLNAADAALADERMVFKDILGRPVVYSEKRPVIFLTHVNNVHWNLLRVEHNPVPELQLFEPMGKPPRRQGGSRYYTQHQPQSGGGGGGGGGARGGGFRCIPKEVYRWLDDVWPLHSSRESTGGNGGGGSRRTKAPSPTPPNEGWASRAYSAITRQQQTTGFDCGVAALLYAEKCGQGQMREDVDAWTTQGDMTAYRRALQRYVEEVLRQPLSPPAASATAAVEPEPAEAGAGARSQSLRLLLIRHRYRWHRRRRRRRCRLPLPPVRLLRR
ncbi:unnamed protein product [Pylaiella littoralis]